MINTIETVKGSVQLPVKNIKSVSNIRDLDKGSEEYNRMKENIAEIGLIQPIVVYKNGDNNYHILAGHKRYSCIKDLGHEMIPVRIIDRPDKNQVKILQYSENEFRIGMSFYEDIMAIKAIIKDNPKTTYQDLSLRFGKSFGWIAGRIRFTNLLDCFLVAGCMLRENLKELKKISLYGKERQQKAVDHYLPSHSITQKQFESKCKTDEIYFYNLTIYLERTTPDMDELRKVFTKEETDEYWKAYQPKRKVDTLFGNSVIDIDHDFVEYCLKQKHPDILQILAEITVKELEPYSFENIRREWFKPFTVKNPVKYLSKWSAWNNDLFNMIIREKSTAKANSIEDTDQPLKTRSKFYGCGTKLARAVVSGYMEMVTNKLPRDDKTLQWAIKNDSYLWSIKYIEDDWHSSVLKNYNTIERVQSEFILTWLDHCIWNTTIKQISELAAIHGKLSLPEWIDRLFSNKESVQFRNNVLSAFKTVDLRSAYSKHIGSAKTKGEIVVNLVNRVNKFKFKGIFTDKDANFWEQMCKTYLQTK